MKKYLTLLAVLGIIGLAGCTCNKKDKLHFDTDSYKLTMEDKTELNQVAERLKKNKSEKVKLYGYADATGTEKHNKTLSRERAVAAAGYLHGKGIADDRIMIKAKGEEHPAATNKTKEGRKENRRVEVKFYK